MSNLRAKTQAPHAAYDVSLLATRPRTVQRSRSLFCAGHRVCAFDGKAEA